nr:MAG TPA: hypothetical protein [Caudoviricetes sp.]
MLSDSLKRSVVTSSRSTIDLYTVKAQSYMKVANELREQERDLESEKA